MVRADGTVDRDRGGLNAALRCLLHDRTRRRSPPHQRRPTTRLTTPTHLSTTLGDPARTMRTLRNLARIPGHGHITALALTGTLIVGGVGDGSLIGWDPSVDAQDHLLFGGHAEHISSLAASSDGTLIVSGSWDTTVKVWDLASCACLRTLQGHQDGVSCVTLMEVTPTDVYVVSGGSDRVIKVWDLASGAYVQDLGGHQSDVLCVAASAAGRCIVSGGLDTRIVVHHWAPIWAPNGWHLVALMRHDGPVWSVAVSDDAEYIVSGSNRTIKIWSMYRLQQAIVPFPTCDFTIHTGSVRIRSLAVSPDSMHIVSASHGKNIKVWDLASGACVRTLEGHTGEVSSVAVSADGRHVVSGSTDGTVKIWDRYQRLPHALIRNRVQQTYAKVDVDQPPKLKAVLHYVYGRNGKKEIGPTILKDLFPLVISYLVKW